MARRHLRWAIHHTETTKVAIRQGKDDHEKDGVPVILEKHWCIAGMCIAEGKQRQENHPQETQQW